METSQSQRAKTQQQQTYPVSSVLLSATSSARPSTIPSAIPTSPSRQTRSIADATDDDKMLNEFQCAICSNIIHKFTAMQCAHAFCRTCIETALMYSPKCPMCRAPHQRLISMLQVDSVIKVLIQRHFTADEQVERQIHCDEIDNRSHVEDEPLQCAVKTRRAFQWRRRFGRVEQHITYQIRPNETRIMSIMPL